MCLQRSFVYKPDSVICDVIICNFPLVYIVKHLTFIGHFLQSDNSDKGMQYKLFKEVSLFLLFEMIHSKHNLYNF